MNRHLITRCAAALSCLLFVGTAAAECRSGDDPASGCRYPAGDAWCARHGDGNPFAYKDGCTDAPNAAGGRAGTRRPAATGSWTPVPTWDCAKARTVVEQLICVNPELRAQDARMGALYGRLQARGLAPERAQKAWLLGRRGACDDVDCLSAAYAERIRELERLDATGEGPAPPRPAETARAAPESAAPQAAEPLPEPVPDADAAVGAQSVAADQTPAAAIPRSTTGIPELPPPERPVWGLPSDRGLGQAVPKPSTWPPGMLSVGLAGLVLAAGLLLWRRRPRARAAVESLRERVAPLGRRVRTSADAGLRGLRDLRERGRTLRSPARPPAADPVAPGAAALPDTGLHLSAEMIRRLSALADPGEPLAAVVARAVEALEAESRTGAADPVLARLAVLEARLAQLEGGPKH